MVVSAARGAAQAAHRNAAEILRADKWELPVRGMPRGVRGGDTRTGARIPVTGGERWVCVSLQEHRRRAWTESGRERSGRIARGRDAAESRPLSRSGPVDVERHQRTMLERRRRSGDRLLEVVDLDRRAARAVVRADELLALVVLLRPAAARASRRRHRGAAGLDDLGAATARRTVAEAEPQKHPTRHAQGGQQQEEQDLDAGEGLQDEGERSAAPELHLKPSPAPGQARTAFRRRSWLRRPGTRAPR